MFSEKILHKEAILNFFSKMLSGETLCKLLQIFPPKVDYLMKIHLTN